MSAKRLQRHPAAAKEDNNRSLHSIARPTPNVTSIEWLSTAAAWRNAPPPPHQQNFTSSLGQLYRLQDPDTHWQFKKGLDTGNKGYVTKGCEEWRLLGCYAMWLL
jgi:hypothetical protein